MQLNTAICMNVDAGFNATLAKQGNPYWKARADAIKALAPQVIRCETRTKDMLDFCASIGATLWPTFFDSDPDTIMAWLTQDHPAVAGGMSRGNEPWFSGTTDGGKWALQNKPIYETIRMAMGDKVWLSLPAILTHDKAPDFLLKMLQAWPALVSVVDAIDLHPYSNKTDPLASNLPSVKAQLQGCRTLLDSHEGQGVAFDLTEFGWATHGSGANAFDVVTEATQSAWEDKTIGYAVARGDVRSLFPYMATETYDAATNENEQRHFGHYRQTAEGGPLTAKPVADRFAAWRKAQVALGASGHFAHTGTTPPPPPTDLGGGDIRWIVGAKTNDLAQGTTVRRVAATTDGRKALTWSNAGGMEEIRIRANDDEWRAMFAALEL